MGNVVRFIPPNKFKADIDKTITTSLEEVMGEFAAQNELVEYILIARDLEGDVFYITDDEDEAEEGGLRLVDEFKMNLLSGEYVGGDE